MPKRFFAGMTLIGLLVCQPALSHEEFRVGYIAAATGASASSGAFFLQGLKPGVDVINQNGGIAGLPVRLVVCDDQSNEVQAVLCARRLIKEDNVNMLIGAGGTPWTVAIEQTVAQAGIPLFSIAAGRVTYADPFKPWAFKATFGNDDMVPVVMDFLKQKAWERVAIIRDNTALGADSSKSFKEIAPQKGINIIADEVYSVSDTDMTSQLTRIRALKPDAIINWAANVGLAGLIAKEAIQVGMVHTPTFAAFNVQVPSYVQGAGPEGTALTYFAAAKITTADEMRKDDPLYGPITAYTKVFKAAYPGKSPNTLSPGAVDALYLAQAAGKTIGRKVLDRTALRDALQNVKDVVGIQGIWTFSPTRHWVSLEAGMELTKYVDGRWVVAH